MMPRCKGSKIEDFLAWVTEKTEPICAHVKIAHVLIEEPIQPAMLIQKTSLP